MLDVPIFLERCKHGVTWGVRFENLNIQHRVHLF